MIGLRDGKRGYVQPEIEHFSLLKERVDTYSENENVESKMYN
jgi:hypothetical protein